MRVGLCVLRGLAALGMAVAFGAPAAESAFNGVSTRHFSHAGWRERDGAPDHIFAIAQTADGFLWLGTLTGLFRFDGTSFERIDRVGDQALNAQPITSMATDRDGGLWVGHRGAGALEYIQGGVVKTIPLGSDRPSITKINVDARGNIWVLANEELWRIQQLSPARIADTWHLPPGRVKDFVIDAADTLWVEAGNYSGGSKPTLAWLRPGTSLFVEAGRIPDGMLYTDGAGSLYLSSIDFLLRPAALQPASSSGASIATRRLPIKATGDMLVEPDGAVWAVHRDSVVRYDGFDALARSSDHPEQGEAFPFNQGLTSDIVRALFRDRDGDIWLGTDGGLDRFRRLPVNAITLPGRATGVSIAASTGGAVWVSSYDGPLMRIDTQSVVSYPEVGPYLSSLSADPDGTVWAAGNNFDIWKSTNGRAFTKLPHPDWNYGTTVAQSMVRDPSGILWFVNLAQTNSARFDGKKWSEVVPAAAKPMAGGEGALAMDDAGQVWQANDDGLLIFKAGTTSARREPLAIGKIRAIYHHGHHMWIGGEQGLALFDGLRFVTLSPRQGGRFTSVDGIVERSNGDVWVRGSRTTSIIKAHEIETIPSSAGDAAVIIDRIDDADGLEKNNHPRTPSLVEASDGRLWFGTDHGLAWAEPDLLAHRPREIPVRVVSMHADGRQYLPASRVELPVLNTHAELTFGALDLSKPERRRFRYLLEGLEHDWHDAGTSRVATYNNLPPGDYVFRVQVTDDLGQWLDRDGRLAFAVPRAWFQTWSFRCAVAVLAAAMLWWLHRWRARQLVFVAAERMRLQMEIRAGERNRIARDLHDTLLQGTTGLVLNFQVALNRLPVDSAERQSMQALLDAADRSVDETRARVTGLRLEIDGGGVARQLREFGESLSRRRGTTFEWTESGARYPLPSGVQDQLILIAREAIRNAVQHANADRVTASLDYEPGGLTLKVVDDGIGFVTDIAGAAANSRGHWGVFGMHERAAEIGATLQVDSAPGHGTRVTLVLAARAIGRRRMGWRRAIALFSRRRDAQLGTST